MKKHVLSLAACLATVWAGNALAADDRQIAGEAVWKKLNCASCHGADAKTPLNPDYPILAGQHSDYLRQSLIAYQRGQAGAPATANIRKNAIMGAMAAQLSPADIENISAWLSSLPGPLSVKR